MTKITKVGQLRLQVAFKTKLSRQSTHAEIITRAIGLFIAQDLWPYSIVENEGFRNMIHVLEPRYEIPSRPYFSNVVVPKIYQDIRAKVESDLKMATFVALTTDGWTSRATESYNTVTAHFIDNDWQMKGYVLQTRKMDESHTGENLAVMLNAAINEWRLVKFSTKPSLTTDMLLTL